MAIHRRVTADQLEARLDINPLYARESEVPKHRLPDGPMLPETAYQIVRDESMLDGNARFNLATFVTTYMNEHADKLYADAYDKNMIDRDEYPQTAEIESRCVNMIAELWHAPGQTIGTSTTGSSEAAMLGGLALKRRWQQRRTAAGKPADTPNIVFGQNVQVVWEKFANYFEVEPRYVPLDADHLFMTADRMLPFVDENTIGVVPVLGSTFTGDYESVEEVCAALDDLQARTGLDIPVHVDAASGGFVAPFVDPDLAWDFQLERVASINASGHKYGLVYPGIGWVVWRETDLLPADLVFNVNYLGGNMPTFALNFSRPGAQVLLQYFVFLRLGREGFTKIQEACRSVAMTLSGRIGAMDAFDLVSDGSHLPVFAFKVAADVTKFTAYDVSRKLREFGWLVPAYSMPPNREELVVLRVVVRNGLGHDLAELFAGDLERAVEWLSNLSGPLPEEEQPGSFAH